MDSSPDATVLPAAVGAEPARRLPDDTGTSRRVVRSRLRIRRTWLRLWRWLPVVVVSALVLAWAGVVPLYPPTVIDAGVGSAGLFVLMMAGTLPFAVYRERRAEADEVLDADDAMIVAFLAGKDAGCPACGYNLRGITRPRCPECDHRIELAFARLDPLRRLRGRLMVVHAACASTAAYFVVTGLLAFVQSRRFGTGATLSFWLGTVLSAALLVLSLVAIWRLWLGQERGRATRLAVVLLMLSALLPTGQIVVHVVVPTVLRWLGL